MSIFTLLGKGGEKNDCLFQLPDRPIGIGTDPNKCSIIYLQGKGNVSAFHCQLVPKQGFWTLTDYSDKGTWLNGKKMTPFQGYRLKEGDVFYLATLENSFCFAEDKAANQGQTAQPQWQVPNQGQTAQPQWQVPNQGQTAQPQWQVPNQGQIAGAQPIETGIKEKFLTINGRLDRKTYIIRGFYLSFIGVMGWLLMGVTYTLLKPNLDNEGVVAVLSMLLALLLQAVPGTMLSVRRLHDLDKSGWFYLIMLIPIANFYLIYLLFIKEGTHGVNRFGAEYHYQASVNPTQRELEEKYLTFEGRLNRKPFILRYLCLLVTAFVIGFLVALILTVAGAVENDIILITQITMMPLIYSFPLLVIRRLHDLDKSGWFYLTMLIPIINLLFIVYLLVAKGTTGPNRYGSDPLA